jgi:hypothetical protein
MTFETLVVERDGALPGLMTLTLNRPEKLKVTIPLTQVHAYSTV